MLPNLTSNWHFENDGVDSVSGHDATFHNGGSFVTAPPTMIDTYSRLNDGVDSYAKVDYHADLDTDSLTWVVWVYPTDTPGAPFTEFPFLMTNDRTVSATKGSTIGLNSNNGTWDARFILNWTGGTTKEHTITGLATNTKHCLIMSFDNTTKVFSVYVDNVLKAQSTETGKTLLANTNEWRFGTRQITASETLAGNFDEYAIFSEAISDGGVAIDEEAGGVVAQIWNGGDGIAIDTIGIGGVGALVNGGLINTGLTRGRLIN